jgi:hypothetical protein
MKHSTINQRRSLPLLLGLLVLVLLAACGGKAPEATATPTVPPLPTDTPAPTATPLPNKIALIAPPEISPAQSQAVQAVLNELAAPAGFVLETLPEIQPADLSNGGWKMAFFLTTPGNLTDLLNAAPQVQFAVVSRTELPTSANLTTILTSPENEAFLAGFLSVVTATDWRAAGLFPADGDGPARQEAYLNGAHYYCGICNPFFAPAVRFPLSYALPGSAGAAEWQMAADELAKNVVYLMYVSPEAASAELLTYLASKNMMLVGSQTPPQELKPYWVATVHQNLAASFRDVFPAMQEGRGGQVVNAALELTDVNEGLISAGKQGLVNQTLETLIKGLVMAADPPME